MSEERRRERKVVSVLFADLVGFTSRAEELDPEDVEAILTPYHSRLRSELERFGGTVEKFIGDAVVAVFGAPVAHEDDPERAVRAALAIRDWVRDEGELEVRTAVNTGEALVSLGARPEQGEGMVTGDVVNTASRLQSAAPVNGILVGHSTYEATSRMIEYRELEPVDAKGKSKPIPVWEAVEARSRFGSDVTYAATTPLVGRERELDVLVDALALVRQQREPQLVTLVGVPGIGKSRLVQELFAAVEQDPELISWRQGRCLPYGEGVAFWALGEILKAQAGVREGGSDERAAEKLRAAVAEVTSEEEETEWLVRHLRPLLGLAEDGELTTDRRMESFGAWRRYFESLAERRPLVLVFEDLHWADEGLYEFVDHLVDWAGPVPILVVGTARPELLARRPGWGGGKPNATTLSLSPLSQEETARLLQGLLERTVLPAEVQSALLERAGGNPLYAEEFARMASERGALSGGADELPLPGSVHGLIAARLDALEDGEKALIQDAAVVGKVFWLGAISALQDAGDVRSVERVLHSLERKQFVRRERRSAVESDTQYAFLHGLVRDVAYGQIPRGARAEKHRRAAAWIESLGRSEDHAEMRAHHYASALEALRQARQDTTEVADAARIALREAGDRAFALSSFATAARHYDRALALWPDDAERPRLLLAAARTRSESRFDNDEELEQARDALLAAGDREGAAEAQIRLVNAHWVRGRGEEVLRHLQRAEALAEALEPSPTKAYVYSHVGRFHMLGDRHERAREIGEQALSMATDLGLDYERASVLNDLGTIRAAAGDRGGLEALRESIEIMERLNSPHVVRSYNNLIYSLFTHGELRQTEALTTRMEEVAERWGNEEWLRWARSERLSALYFGGHWEDASRLVEELLAALADSGPHYLEGDWRLLRSRLRLARGDDQGAELDASIALERARTAADPQIMLPALSWRALQLANRGDPRGGDLAREVLTLSRTIESRVAHFWFPDVAQALAALGRNSDVDELAGVFQHRNPWMEAGLALASGDFGAAAETFAEMGAAPNEAEARLLAAKAGIDADLPAAIEFFRSVGATAYLSEAEALLAKSRSA